MTTLQDTIRIHKDTCKINQGYMRDKCICSGSRIHEGYMRDTSKIHFGIRVSQMYPERYVSEIRIHAGYMRDTCISARVIKIHAGYIRDTL